MFFIEASMYSEKKNFYLQEKKFDKSVPQWSMRIKKKFYGFKKLFLFI